MKSRKLSLDEKKIVRTFFLLMIIQIMIIGCFVVLMRAIRPIDIKETKQTDITVDNLYITRVPREDQLVVESNSTCYLFTGRATFEEYSVHSLYDSISKGDRLSLIYYETKNYLGKKINIIVDARTETEIYRSLEAYNVGSQWSPVLVVILFFVFELLFIGVAFVYGWLNGKSLKSIFLKIKKRLL